MILLHFTKRLSSAILTLFPLLLLTLCEIPPDPNSDKKIAFLFFARGPMPLEDIWRQFFRWRADPKYYNIYVHPHKGYHYPATSFFHGKEIQNNIEVKWGGFSQVKALKNLVETAVEDDPLNEWFCIMSESCIPLIPFEKWRNIMLQNTKSIVNACFMGHGEMETEARWKSSLDGIGMKKEYWRKSATWAALNRKHATVFYKDPVEHEAAWENVMCVDEHYLASTLAWNHLDNETTCTDGFVHVNWPSLIAAHPRTYNADEVNAELFAYFERAVGAGAGFGQQCSGFKEVCHFTARKFAPSTKYALLENLDLMLGDEDMPYTGNPWDHHQDKLRRNGSDSSLVLLENGFIRPIPDKETLAGLHLSLKEDTLPLSKEDVEMHPLGDPFPSRRDHLVYKTRKSSLLWYMKDAHRHHILNMDAFYQLNTSFIINFISDMDLEHIAIGKAMPHVEG